jgi:hypothetical protein
MNGDLLNTLLGVAVITAACVAVFSGLRSWGMVGLSLFCGAFLVYGLATNQWQVLCGGSFIALMALCGMVIVGAAARQGQMERQRRADRQPIEEYVQVYVENGQAYHHSRKTVHVRGGVAHREASQENIDMAYNIASGYWSEPNFYSAQVDFNTREARIQLFDMDAYQRRGQEAEAVVNATGRDGLAGALMARINPPPIITKVIKF